jgi:hypothetical protein
MPDRGTPEYERTIDETDQDDEREAASTAALRIPKRYELSWRDATDLCSC